MFQSIRAPRLVRAARRLSAVVVLPRACRLLIKARARVYACSTSNSMKAALALRRLLACAVAALCRHAAVFAQTVERVSTAAQLQRAIASGAQHVLVTEHINALDVKRVAGSTLDDGVATASRALRSLRVRDASTSSSEIQQLSDHYGLQVIVMLRCCFAGAADSRSEVSKQCVSAPACQRAACVCHIARHVLSATLVLFTWCRRSRGHVHWPEHAAHGA